jgi:hypothetical protein
MRAVLTEPFAANLIASPPEVQKAFGKQLTNLLRDLRHPSLRAKKYEERTGLWPARINMRPGFAGVDNDLYYNDKCMSAVRRRQGQPHHAHHRDEVAAVRAGERVQAGYLPVM